MSIVIILLVSVFWWVVYLASRSAKPNWTSFYIKGNEHLIYILLKEVHGELLGIEYTDIVVAKVRVMDSHCWVLFDRCDEYNLSVEVIA